MKVNRLRSLCVEIYKLVNNINPTYMNEIFKLRKISTADCSNHKLNLDVPAINQVSFGGKSLACRMPLHTPKTSETRKKKHALFDSENFKVCGRSHV